MTFKRSFLLLMTVVLSTALHAQPSLLVDSIYCPSVGKMKSFSIFVPKEYDSKRSYPVLYLLHGYGGDHTNWSLKTRLVDYLRDVPLIVVMPDGENSWYIDASSRPHAAYERYLTSDLPAYIEKEFAVDRTKQAIAGLSMGGYGATMLSMKHPGRYRLAASLSGALSFPRFINDSALQRVSPRLLSNTVATFGAPGSPERTQNDPFTLFRSVPADSFTFYYFAVGTNDGFRDFLPVTRMLCDSLRTARIPYEYHETPGRHDWVYWDREIRGVLIRMREWMKF